MPVQSFVGDQPSLIESNANILGVGDLEVKNALMTSHRERQGKWNLQYCKSLNIV